MSSYVFQLPSMQAMFLILVVALALDHNQTCYLSCFILCHVPLVIISLLALFYIYLSGHEDNLSY